MVRRNELVLEASKSFETGNRMEAGQPAKGAEQLVPLRYHGGYPPLKPPVSTGPRVFFRWRSGFRISTLTTHT